MTTSDATVPGFLPIAGICLEAQLLRDGFGAVIGTDEAGRGPLAGPVVAAAVRYRECNALRCSCDSKLLTAPQREDRYHLIVDELVHGIGIATPQEIDSVNILRASMLAMQRAVEQIAREDGTIVLVDGCYPLPGRIRSRSIIDGDARVAVIGAASIIAKVSRDRMMAQYDLEYPQYGFAKHMGYPTPEHRRVLKEIGPCKIHRKSFRGVREFFADCP